MKGGRRFLDPRALARISRLDLVAHLVVEGFITGLHRSPYQGFSVEFSEHKEYSPGDNLRHLDWKVYARTDKYYIKQYQEETNLKGYILLDASGSMGYRSDGLSKLEYGCYMAATLAYLMIRQRDSVGLLTFDKAIRQYIPPKSTPRHLKLILQELEKTQSGETTNLSKTFHDLAETIKRRGLIIVLSDLMDEPEEVMKGLKHFRHRKHEVIVFHILDKKELDFSFRNISEFRDMESRERLLVNPGFIRQEYQEAINAFLRHYRRECSESMIDYLRVDTSLPYDFVLASYLSRRARMG